MNKTMLITGSTDGIGKLSAIKLAKEGHEILLHGRNAEKLAAVVEELKEATGNPNIAGYMADFANMEAVKQMADQIKEKVVALDIVINNAGIFKSPIKKTEAGFDLRFAVNYLAPYLLTKELLPLMGINDASRIINVSSAAQAAVSEAALRGNEQISMQASYAQSKLALTMWSLYLAERTVDPSVIAVNPGSLLNTNMVKEAYGYHWSPADKGANILYDLAISDKFEGITGKYFDNDQGAFGDAHSDAYDDHKINSLIHATEKLLASYLLD